MTREVPFAQFWGDQKPLWGEPTIANEDHPLEEAIAKVLAEFSDKDREILVMSLMGELSTRQIANFVGLSKSQVHRRLRVLIPQLRIALSNNSEVTEHVVNLRANQETST